MSNLIKMLDELPDDLPYELHESGGIEPSGELINGCLIEMLVALLHD